MKDYVGWLRKDVFVGQEYSRLLAEMEGAQFRFIVENSEILGDDGWIRQDGHELFSGDNLYAWSRQFEYLYVAANIERGDQKILDVGCGFNFLAWWLSRNGHDVTCSDSLDLAKLFPAGGPRFIQDDITRTRIDEQYDCVYCLSVLEHIGRKREAVENLLKLTRPGGKLVLTLDCALDRKFGDTPTVENIYLLVHLINETFGCTPENIRFERDENLITTESFYHDQAWRLPWKDPNRPTISRTFKRMLRRLMPAPKRSLTVFLGTWRRPE